MFDAISPTYDLLNHMLSFNVDRLWRRELVSALDARLEGLYLDLCSGTGDVALLLKGAKGGRVVAIDFSAGMLLRAGRKAKRAGRSLLLARADAMALPLAGGAFDGVAVAFGVRNFENLDRGLQEIARVLKPGGRAAILEFAEPRRGTFALLYSFYFHRVLPVIGRVVSGLAGAYAYLPATVAGFPSADEFAGRLTAAGFVPLDRKPLTGGIAMLHVAARGAGALGRLHESRQSV